MLTRCPAYWFKTPARNSCAPRAARVIARDGSAKVLGRHAVCEAMAPVARKAC